MTVLGSRRTLCVRMMALLLVGISAFVTVGCDSKAPKTEDNAPLKLPPPPAVPVVEATPTKPEAAAPSPLVMGDQYSPESVNLWKVTSLEPTSQFALVATRGAYTHARLALEAGIKPEPARARADELLSAFTFPANTGGKALGVVVDSILSPFEDGRAFARITVHALPPKALTQRAPQNIGALVILSADSDALAPAQRLLRDLAERWGRDAIEERGDTLSVIHDGDATPPTRLREQAAIYAAIERLEGRPGAEVSAERASTGEPAALLKAALEGTQDKHLIILTDAPLPPAWSEAIGSLGEEVVISALALRGGAEQLEGFEPAQRHSAATLKQGQEALDAVLGFDSEEDVAVHDATAIVTWQNDAVKSFRVLGFENHEVISPSVGAHPLRRGQQVTAIYELMLREENVADLGHVEVSYAMQPGGASQVLSAPVVWPVEREETSKKRKKPKKTKPEDEAPDPTTQQAEHTRFAVAVAAFAERLRANPEVEGWSMETIQGLAESALIDDPERVAFVELIKRSAPLYPDPVLSEDALAIRRPSKKKPGQSVKSEDLRSIKGYIKKNNKDVASCGKRVKMKYGSSSGRVVVSIAIKPSGEVRSVRVVQDEIGHNIDNCIEGKISRWKFPSLTQAVKLRHSFKL